MMSIGTLTENRSCRNAVCRVQVGCCPHKPSLQPLLDTSSATPEQLSGINELLLDSPIQTGYLRLALLFRKNTKTSLYANLYGGDGWGFGVRWIKNVW